MIKKDRSEQIRTFCTGSPVVPVLIIDECAVAKSLAKALIAGGLKMLEIPLRTSAALDCIRTMSKIGGGIVGAGTVLTAEDVEAAKTAGARYAVSPGATDELIEATEATGLPLLPGAATASEIMRLLALGYTVQKFFPAESIGGVCALRNLAGPLPQVSFCPTGGISPANADAYLSLSNVICVGGSWVAPPDAIMNGDWERITDLAREAATLVG